MSVWPARITSLPLALVLLAATGCSAVFDSLNAPDIEEVDDLGALCEDPGNGYSEAAAYSGEGPHPAAIFTSALRSDTDHREDSVPVRPNPEADDDATPIQPWYADSLEEVALLICADGDGPKDPVHTCEFSGGMTLPMFSQDFTITVHELATGEELHSSRLTATGGNSFGNGSHQECPAFIQFPEEPTELYAAPYADEVHEALSDIVESPAG